MIYIYSLIYSRSLWGFYFHLIIYQNYLNKNATPNSYVLVNNERGTGADMCIYKSTQIHTVCLQSWLKSPLC